MAPEPGPGRGGAGAPVRPGHRVGRVGPSHVRLLRGTRRRVPRRVLPRLCLGFGQEPRPRRADRVQGATRRRRRGASPSPRLRGPLGRRPSPSGRPRHRGVYQLLVGGRCAGAGWPHRGGDDAVPAPLRLPRPAAGRSDKTRQSLSRVGDDLLQRAVRGPGPTCRGPARPLWR